MAENRRKKRTSSYKKRASSYKNSTSSYKNRTSSYKNRTYGRRRRNRTAERNKRILILLLLAAACISIFLILRAFSSGSDAETTRISSVPVFSTDETGYNSYSRLSDTSGTAVASGKSSAAVSEVIHNVSITVQEMLLTPNEYSRPTELIDQVNGIVVHYVANPGTTGVQNRNYFENLKTGEDGTYASSHFIIGLDGEIIQCIPLDEVAYASNERNSDTISIECCHPDETGEFTEETYQSLVDLTTWLCEEYSLSSDSVIRHYDVTGKECPKYFVDNEDAWIEFRRSIDDLLA